MSNTTPSIFPISEPPRHYNDYGFDPQPDYFQVLEEAKRSQNKKQSSFNLDPHHFNRRKPKIHIDQSITKSQNKKRWWKKNPFHLFFTGKRRRSVPEEYTDTDTDTGGGFHHHRVPVGFSKSGPAVYIIESRSGSSTPHRNSSPIAGNMSPALFPYVNVNQQQHCSRMSTSAMPIYLVT